MINKAATITKAGLFFFLIILLLVPFGAMAQSYSFAINQAVVDVYLQPDGTIDVVYRWTFQNDPEAAWIDFVDVGLPDKPYDASGIQAVVKGQPAAYISSDEYEGNGNGVAVALGEAAIPPGGIGEVAVFIPGIANMFHPDTADGAYASMVFSPTWFDGQYVNGETNLQVTYHMPPGVKTNEPRWHVPPSGWAEPQVGVDNEGRTTYTWRNGRANGYTQYKFGASVPRVYLAADAVKNPTLYERLNISADAFMGWLVGLGFFAIFAGSTVWGFFSSQRRRMQYLPPKISIEGHGIKRGLTAVEAAILMEKPLDRVLTMVLFGVIRKGAAQVRTREPLELEAVQPAPEGLHAYETGFLSAFQETDEEARKLQLQKTVIQLIKSVATKMKGFSLKETLAYYERIVDEAWSTVESAGTPEVRGARYDELMDWTLLDNDYDDRTRRLFRDEPVPEPSWWRRYQPSSSSSSSWGSSSVPSGGGLSMPTLPGANFAASIVTNVQSFSANVIGGLGNFTGAVTSKTNPAASSSSGSGSGGSNCACACAGCACACAGGGR